MPQYYAIITDVGNAKISNALALGKTISLTHMAVGDSNGSNSLPAPNQKNLVNEKFRGQINSLTIDDENQNVVICEFIIPEDVGGFYVRELGVFDNEGNLISVGNTPESYKPKMTEGSGAQKVMRMHLVTSASNKIELKINPSIVVATIDLVNKKVDEINKTKAAINASNIVVADYLHKLGLKDSSLTASGWQKLPSGLIIQWGFIKNIRPHEPFEVLLPIRFPNLFFSVVGTVAFSSAQTGSTISMLTESLSSVLIYAQTAVELGNIDVHYIAIGY